LGANYNLNDATELSVNYDLTNRSDYSDSLISLKARWNF